MAVSLSQVKAHLRLDTSSADEDALLLLYMDAAWGSVRAFTNVQWDILTAAPFMVNAAVLLLVADLYENREAQSPVGLKDNKTVDRLLWPHRVW